MKVLHLPLKKEWYIMIESGVKPEEYREIKPYWCKRFTGYEFLLYSFRNGHNKLNAKGYTHVRFSYGYTRRTMTFEIDSITIGKGKTEWGAPAHEKIFIIKLGKRVIEQ